MTTIPGHRKVQGHDSPPFLGGRGGDAEEAAMPAVGDLAPEFALQSDRGETVNLSQFAGQRVVVYFYYKAGTGG